MPARGASLHHFLKAGFNHLISRPLPFCSCNMKGPSYIMTTTFIVMVAGTTALTENYLYYANRQHLVHVNRDGSGTQIFTLNSANAIAVDYDIRYIIQTNL